ncbi:hypothetical protein ACMU_09525 [Actibacterium mucosum KCTC 23349]|uniref:3-deoxy-D-manno-octulosonic acid transferase n=1 Tax=Actibacterium mucosum KCTC 23349 TaxID=1454373 RepID=A0A037ZK39_9RHOB|nr:hypothetical protein ACMU_09525 [Actibacterium mucosum KCTC 23349]
MFLYRIVLTLLSPFFALHMLRADQNTRRARLGLVGPDGATRGQVLWLHAASNGEATAARGLIETLVARDPALTLLVTCNSTTGRALVESWKLTGVTALPAPLDYRLALRSFLANWTPEALIIVENELWPNRIAAMARRNRPVLVVSARMSSGSARMWSRFPGVARRVMAGLTMVWPQSSADGDRLGALGLSPLRLSDPVNLKLGTAAMKPDAQALAKLAGVLKRENTFLAASTHDGEDAPLIRGFARARAEDPSLKMILAPRHPRRGAAISALLNREGLSHAMRSAGQGPAPDTAVLLADTLGEMGLWYSLAGVTFVGGSLVDKGGHTPVEPAQFGSAILHGPHLDNFAELYDRLQADRAATLVQSADELKTHLLNRRALAVTALRAQAAVDGLRGQLALHPVLQELARLTGNPALAQENGG